MVVCFNYLETAYLLHYHNSGWSGINFMSVEYTFYKLKHAVLLLCGINDS
jgi:hypothetical protein